jgi:Leukotriene A4 hydrolase, C-terminal
VVFLETLEQKEALPALLVNTLNTTYSLDITKNGEVRLR